LKPSHFADEDFQQADGGSAEEDQEPLGVVEDVEMADAGEDGVDDMDRDAASEDGEDRDSEVESMEVDIDAGVQSLNPKRVDAVAIPNSVARVAAPHGLIFRRVLAREIEIFKSFIQAPRCELAFGTRRV